MMVVETYGMHNDALREGFMDYSAFFSDINCNSRFVKWSGYQAILVKNVNPQKLFCKISMFTMQPIKL